MAGLRVLGRATTLAILSAGENRDSVATELGVTMMVAGSVRLQGNNLDISTRLVRLPAGNTVWRDEQRSSIQDGAAMHRSIVQAIVDAILPPASAHATHAPRIEADECADGFELYLRGRQLRETQNWQRGIELLNDPLLLGAGHAASAIQTSAKPTPRGLRRHRAAQRSRQRVAQVCGRLGRAGRRLPVDLVQGRLCPCWCGRKASP